MPSRCIALVPAAGGGRRFGGTLPKQYADLAGRPLLERTIDALVRVLDLHAVFVALAPDDELFGERLAPRRSVEPLFCGGATRAETVANALTALAERCRDDDWILVHDAARPCVPAAALRRLVAELGDDAVGGLLAVPVAVRSSARIRKFSAGAPTGTGPDWQAQTPDVPLRRAPGRLHAGRCARGY
jgi:2-C-methyl-D-erythritol 4-phosphate cytidylyltransferase